MHRSLVAVPREVEPWRQPYEQRLRELHAGAPRVLFYYEKPDTSTFRYRVYNMIQALRTPPGPEAAGLGPVGATWCCREDADHFDAMLAAAQVLVLCRARYDHTISRLVHRARERGLRVLYDVDDLVFNLDYVHLVMHTLEVNQQLPDQWDTWFAYVARQGATMKLCDGAIVTNEFLAHEATLFTGKPSFVVPNFCNEEQLTLSAALFAEKQRRPTRATQPPCIGYFSGSPTHNKDFDLISGALAQLLERWPALTLRAIGFLNIRGALARHGARIDVRPLTDFLSLQKLIAEVDVNVVPLQDNVFTHCKSELKYFEAAIVGTPSIMSPTHVYTRCIADGVNGVLAHNHEWEARIEALLEQPERARAMAAAAHAHALAAFSPTAQRPAIIAALWPDAARTPEASARAAAATAAPAPAAAPAPRGRRARAVA